MHLYLIRHGETDWNVEGRCQGFSDSPLNDTGRKQAEAISRHLSHIAFDGIYSSTLKRAHETAQIIARYHAMPVLPREGLRELNQGDFEGLLLTELFEKHADFLEQWFRDPADLRVPGGESLREMQTRAWSALQEIIDSHADGNVAVVAHNLCNSALLCRIMRLDLADFRRIHQDVGGISVVEFGGRWPHPVVLQFNDTCHLH